MLIFVNLDERLNSLVNFASSCTRHILNSIPSASKKRGNNYLIEIILYIYNDSLTIGLLYTAVSAYMYRSVVRTEGIYFALINHTACLSITERTEARVPEVSFEVSSQCFTDRTDHCSVVSWNRSKCRNTEIDSFAKLRPIKQKKVIGPCHLTHEYFSIEIM